MRQPVPPLHGDKELGPPQLAGELNVVAHVARLPHGAHDLRAEGAEVVGAEDVKPLEAGVVIAVAVDHDQHMIEGTDGQGQGAVRAANELQHTPVAGDERQFDGPLDGDRVGVGGRLTHVRAVGERCLSAEGLVDVAGMHGDALAGPADGEGGLVGATVLAHVEAERGEQKEEGNCSSCCTRSAKDARSPVS